MADGKKDGKEAAKTAVDRFGEMALRLRNMNDWRQGKGAYEYDGPPEDYQPFPAPETPEEWGKLIGESADILEELGSILRQMTGKDALGDTQLGGLCDDCNTAPWMFGGCDGSCWVARLSALAGVEDEIADLARNRDKSRPPQQPKEKGRKA